MTVDPNYPYFLLGMLIFLSVTGIWMFFEDRKLNKEIAQNARSPRKDIRKWDLETYYRRKTHKHI